MKRSIIFFSVTALIALTACDDHTHTFDKKVNINKYLQSAADCTHPAVYYYSCECGEKGTDTFEFGSTSNHSFTNYVSNNDATHQHDGTKTAKCDHCHATNTITDVGSKTPHTFSNDWSFNETYHWKAATCEHKEEKSGNEKHSFDENGKCKICGYSLITHKVTADEWKQSFGQEKPFWFSENYRFDIAITDGFSQNFASANFIADGNKALIHTEEDGEISDTFAEKNGNIYTCYCFDEDSKEWTKEDMTSETFTPYIFVAYLLPFVDNYGSFTYDSSKELYKCEALTFNGVEYNNISFKFDDKKIMSINVGFKRESNKVTNLYTAKFTFKYGDQKVTLPEIKEKETVLTKSYLYKECVEYEQN